MGWTARVAIFGIAVLAAAAPARAEVTRTLRAEIPDATRAAFGVENLVGAMRITAGAGDATTVTATVHAENGALADEVRLDRVAGDGGAALISVRYPAGVRSLLYPESNDDSGWLLDLFSVGEKRRYRGEAFRVSRSHGQLLYVDLDVRVPARITAGTFRNLVGRLEASGVEGTLAFDVESADLRLEHLGGTIGVRGSSGDMTASEISGDWKSELTSGDSKLRRFRVGGLTVRTTSGDIDAEGVEAARLEIRSTSGDSTIEDADVQDLEARTTSGNVDLEQRTPRLARVEIEATSGDVRLRLPRDASFRAEANLGSGDLTVGYDDATVLERHDKPTGCRRGTGGAQIHVRTTSGNLAIEPR